MARRTEQVVTTFFKEEKAVLEELAKEDGLPVATWLRRLIRLERTRRDTLREAPNCAGTDSSAQYCK